MGADRVVWGTDALWTGSPQWQIEGLRRLEIPEEMQKKYGYAPLGPADGPVKTAIFSGNNIKPLQLSRSRKLVEDGPIFGAKGRLFEGRPAAHEFALRLRPGVNIAA